MFDSLYEIVVLADGDIVLQRADDKENPLMKISFSEETNAYIEGMRIDVAKAMIGAAIETIEQGNTHNEGVEDSLESSKGLTLH